MYLNYFPSILSGLVFSVVYWVFWVVGSNPAIPHINFFSLQIEESGITFMNISSMKYHLSVI